MATKKAPKTSAAALAADDNTTIPRIKLGSTGISGLSTNTGRIQEESNNIFRYPQFIRVVREMRNSPTVGATNNVYEMFMTRPEWYVEAPVGATEVEIERAKLVESMMHDMDGTSWNTFIKSVVPYREYGFAINEIVLRRRLTKNGSRFNDGLIGIKDLAPRNQETIEKWNFDETDTNKLVSVQQSTHNMENSFRYIGKLDSDGYITIPREKFLLFTCSETKGNPQGNSVYKNIYRAFKELTLVQEQQLISIAKEVQGILKITLPIRYFDPEASIEDKAVLASFQTIINNYNAGTQRGLLVPSFVNDHTKLPEFTYDLMESKGTTKNNTESIIRGLQQDILTALSCDILKLGADGTGSFSLAESKSSVLALAVMARMEEIKSVLNIHLMRLIYEMNGWSVERLPKFCYKDIEEVSLDELGKYLQRVISVGAVELDREVLNKIRTGMGVSAKPDDEPVDKESLSGADSKAGSGMEQGTSGSGTAKIGGKGKKQDNSANNSENAS